MLSKVAAKKLLDFLQVKVSVNAWDNVAQAPGRMATLQSTADLGECLRELSWTRVLIQGQLAAFDDKYASAKQQLQVQGEILLIPCYHTSDTLFNNLWAQEFEERRNQLDELRNSRVNDSLALSAVEAFFEQQDSPSRSPKYRAQSPTVRDLLVNYMCNVPPFPPSPPKSQLNFPSKHATEAAANEIFS